MGRSLFILVSDDQNLVHSARQWGHEHNATVQCYSPGQWSENLRQESFHSQLELETPPLASGAQSVEGYEGKVIAFPSKSSVTEDKSVVTIDQMESKAIEEAIHAFHGNLTEAAKALGIGRATLYRKVKQYKIDPSLARNRTNKAA